MNKPILFFGLALAAVWGGGIATRQIKLASKSCYEVYEYQVLGFSLTKARIKITFKVKNTTDIGFVIHRQSYKVYINKYEVADIIVREDMNLAANSSAYPSIEIEFSPKRFIKNTVSELFKTGSNTAVRIVGKLSLKSGILFYNNLKVDATTTLYEILNNTSPSTPC